MAAAALAATLACAALAALAAWLACVALAPPPTVADAPAAAPRVAAVSVGGRAYQAEIVADHARRIQGLSGRPSLPAGRGMLFVFERAARHGIWMKDMRFSLDIVWLDAGGAVVHVERDVAPQTWPKIFRPPTPARYVLEVNPGSGIRAGQRARGLP